ncbi:2'-5' RNA ligase [Verrucomicrobiia bacterium DG1235]|nr:2'-5' RNA ligase [Verrucomicrobiae bacterium DG1235]
MAGARYFIAVDLPEEHRRELTGLRSSGKGFAWTRLERMHVTLRFIGELEGEQVERLVEGLAVVEVERFVLPLEGAGIFPARGRPRVLWVGVGSGHPRLFQLRQRIDDLLLKLGIEADVRSFHPHVTIARIRDGSSVNSATEWVKRRREFVGAPFRVEGFVLYASRLYSNGARYERVAEYALGD